MPKGFYGLSSVFVLLASMALARICSIEQLRYVAAGEWGNLLGLDRVPEVRTLREKLKRLCTESGLAARWNAVLAKEWIGQQETEQSSGLAFYIDGHVRVYHGELTKLPLRQIYNTEVDLIPDLNTKTLTVCLHHLTQAAHDAAVRYLCEESPPRKPSFRVRTSGWCTNLGHPKFPRDQEFGD